MCGIFGIVDIEEKIDRQRFDSALLEIKHRGPDQWNSTFVENVALGHVRLSIHDLNERAKQPMESEDGTLIFNGEIYNYHKLKQEIRSKFNIEFKSTSDTEVLLALLDRYSINDVIEKIDGMYAFAYYSKKTKDIVIARDLCGEKPLYLYQYKGGIAFSSELKSIYAYFNNFNTNQYLQSYLEKGYCEKGTTPVTSVTKLEPDSFARISVATGRVDIEIQKQLRIEKYFSKSKHTVSFEQAQKTLSELLHTSVEQMLDADVPVCTFLSGGVDSSLVTAIAAKIRSGSIESYCIGFENPDYDESPAAQKVADHLGVKLNTHIFTGEDALGLVQKLPQVYDEPICDPSVFPTIILNEFASKSFKVALSGDGADELFMGYSRYANVISRFRKWQKFKRFGGGLALSTMLPLLRHEFAARISDYINLGHSFEDFYEVSLRKYPTKSLPFVTPSKYISSASDNGLTFLEKMSLADLRSYMPDDVLVKVDRAAMFSSLESRAPFLAKDIVEYAIRLPNAYKNDVSTNGTAKRILKSLLEQHIPAEYIYRPKKGFAAPIASWMRNELSDWCISLINDADSLDHRIDAVKLKTQYENLIKGEFRLADGIWASLNYLNWKRFNYAS